MTRRLAAVLAIVSLCASGAGLAVAQDTPRAARERAATERAPSKLQPTRRGRRVDVSFEDAGLPELVRFVARVTRRRFIVPSQARDLHVTIVSERPVTPTELYEGFLAVLQMNGLTVVRRGRYHVIVGTEDISGQTIPVVTDETAGPRSSAYQLRMIRVRDGSLDDAVELLRHFSSPGGSVSAHAHSRTLLITDTAENTRRMLAILRGLREERESDSLFVQRLEHADAEAIAETLRQVAN